MTKCVNLPASNGEMGEGVIKSRAGRAPACGGGLREDLLGFGDAAHGRPVDVCQDARAKACESTRRVGILRGSQPPSPPAPAYGLLLTARTTAIA